jgi:hypothetical protein
MAEAHNGVMTLSDCPICGRRELRGERSLHAFPTPRGDVLALTCRRCGSVVTAGSGRVLRSSEGLLV